MYCNKCGAEIMDEAVICPKCGCPTDTINEKRKQEKSSEMRTLTKVFMILGCVLSGFLIVPLLWTIPMTIKYNKAVEANEPVSMAFAICSLFFVSAIAGILMLFENN